MDWENLITRRPRLDVGGQLIDVLVQMAEGNPGGIRILTDIVKSFPDPIEAFGVILNMDDMNIRGSQIWAGWKDCCGSDLQAFIKAIDTRSPELVEKLNAHLGAGDERAVTGGASYKHGGGRF